MQSQADMFQALPAAVAASAGNELVPYTPPHQAPATFYGQGAMSPYIAMQVPMTPMVSVFLPKITMKAQVFLI